MVNSVTKVCPACGKTFVITKGATAHRYTVCSMACKTRDTKYVNCKRCGKRFRAEKRLNRHFCSESCRRPPVYINCRHCGAARRVGPMERPRSFCNLACYRRFRGENRLEARVREALERLGVVFEQEAKVGRWSVDFLLPDLMVILEADGAYWHAKTVERDARRDAEMTSRGYRVARIKDIDINDTDDIDGHIAAAVGLAPSTPGLMCNDNGDVAPGSVR